MDGVLGVAQPHEFQKEDINIIKEEKKVYILKSDFSGDSEWMNILRFLIYKICYAFSGHGIGSLVTGILYNKDVLGPVWTLRFYSALSLFLAILSFLVNRFCIAHHPHKDPSTTTGKFQRSVIYFGQKCCICFCLV